VEIDGIQQAGFGEATIPDSTSDIIEYREGTDTVLNNRKLSGITKHGNLVLKWGITESMDLYNWRKMVEQGKTSTARRT
jgi:phage tail-like protein